MKTFKNFSEYWKFCNLSWHDLPTFADYWEWAVNKTKEERVGLLRSLTIEQKRSIIRDYTKRKNEMTTPRYEYRFPNGDIFFSNQQEHALGTSASMIADHLTKLIVKNRLGSIGQEVYMLIFPEKHKNVLSWNINANIELRDGVDNTMEVWANGQLIREIKEEGNVHFDVWRLLNALSRVGK